MNKRVAIIGVGWEGFRVASPELSYKELMYAAASRAYMDAGIDPRRDIQSFVTVAEDFHEGTSIFDEYVPDQLGGALKPVHTICGDGLHALAVGTMLILTGQFEIVAIEGHSKASNVLTMDEITLYAQDPVINRPMRFNTHFIAGMEMNRFLYESGNTHEQCASVVVKNRRNALRNPSAPYAANLSLKEVMDGPPLSWPLGSREVSAHADGAVVMVLASETIAQAMSDPPIWILGVGWCNGSPSLESRDWASAAYMQKAAQIAYRQAGIQQPKNAVDFAEIDDRFAYKELQSLEAVGLCPTGTAGKLTSEGYTEPTGEMPVNVSGGSLGCGDLIEANGLARALEIVLQLRGEAGQRQLNNVKTGLAQSWRGLPTTSGAVAIFSN
ncbi:MAG: acetyl-CoA acetyltransferase [Anaerolineales bacterium]|nr:acetyl-CoA acetyltransferase [Anaerolineales bacterium]